MTDTAALRKKIRSKGVKYQWLAEQLGLSAYGLQLKVENANEFKISEAMALAAILSITPEERDAIFFAPKEDLQSTGTK